MLFKWFSLFWHYYMNQCIIRAAMIMSKHNCMMVNASYWRFRRPAKEDSNISLYLKTGREYKQRIHASIIEQKLYGSKLGRREKARWLSQRSMRIGNTCLQNKMHPIVVHLLDRCQKKQQHIALRHQTLWS